MKMKTNRIVAVLAMALIGMVMLGNGAFAQKDGRRGAIARKLDLTDAQKEQIKANREKFKTDNAAALAEIKALREQLKNEIKNKDAAGAKATREQLKAKMQALKPAREALQGQMKQLLTAEQQQKLERLRAERREHIKERRKEWKDRHPGKGGSEG
jgi:Spy/CpxP family protein refolding chaperone